MEDSKSSKVDKKSSGVVRPLIKHKKGLGDFVRFLAAYVPQLESWIVFGDNTVFKKDLSEKDAQDLSYLLNEARWNQIKADKEAIKSQSIAAVLDLESIYNAYPRKIGKKLGLARLKQKLKTPEKVELCLEAAHNYARHCEENRTEEKFIKHFSTWVNSWEDWIPETTEVNSLKHSQTTFDDITKKIQL